MANRGTLAHTVRARQSLAALVMCLLVFAHVARAQSPDPTPTTNRTNAVARQLKELRWSTSEGHDAYLQIKDNITKRLLTEVDGFIAETFSPRSTTTVQVKAGLDALLDHKKGSTLESVAFQVNLPTGRFLLIGVEIVRGGGAIPEDAISFRAYREAGEHFQAVADLDYPRDGAPYDSVEILASVNAMALSYQPIATEFWFAGWAVLPGAAPPTVTARLFGFDGERFRILWATAPFVTPNVDQAIDVTQDGRFTVRRMPDFKGMTVINEQYAVTADGPQKVTEWKTERR
jgi:hypothetical protein